MALKFEKKELEKMPKIPNSLPHILLHELFDEYNDIRFKDIKDLSSIHKLNYKLNFNDSNNSFYNYLVNN